ncbi:hypothetical protein BST_2995 [Bacillus stercoris]
MGNRGVCLTKTFESGDFAVLADIQQETIIDSELRSPYIPVLFSKEEHRYKPVLNLYRMSRPSLATLLSLY